jgi:uncharacterized RDD family membrane protein YckC
MKNIATIHTPENVYIPFETAGLGTRALAKLIDFFCIGIILLPFILIAPLFADFFTVLLGDVTLTIFAVLFVISSSVPLVYFVCLEYWMKGQTIGKRVMGIRVIDEHGGQPGFFAIFLRNLLLLADFFPVFFAAGMVTMFLHSREKRLGDLTAGTLVVMESKAPEELFFQHASPHLSPKERDLLKQVPVLPGHRFMLLQSFLLRRNELDPAARRNLVQGMLEAWWPEVETRPGFEEAFLEKAYLYLRKQMYPARLPHIRYFPKELTR